MAERFQETVQLRPVDVRTGQVQALEGLVQKLEGFKQQGLQLAGTQAIQRGELQAQSTELTRGSDGITEAPEKKIGSSLGRISAQQHNKTLMSAYIASLDNDNREAILRIAAENQNNLIGFNSAIEGYRRGLIKGVDPAVRLTVTQELDSKITTARIAIRKNERNKQRILATDQMNLSAQSALEDSKTLARNGDVLGSAERLRDLFNVYGSQVDAGIITQPEAEIKRRDAEFQATKETLIGGIKKTVEAGDYNTAIEAIVEFREKVPRGFTIDEHDGIIKSMTAEINESLSLHNKLEDTEEAAVKTTQQNTYIDLFSGITTGTATSSDVIEAVNNKLITVEQASKLTTTLNSRGKGVDDWALVTRLQDDIRNGDNVRDVIISNTGQGLTESTAAELLEASAQADDRESLLQTNSVKRAEGFITQSMRITGPLGALDTEAERRLANARRDFATRVLAGENEWDVADELIGKDEFDRAANPRFGNKQNLELSKELLDNALLTNQIDDDTYNFEIENLNRLFQLQENIAAFDKSRKEALNAR